MITPSLRTPGRFAVDLDAVIHGLGDVRLVEAKTTGDGYLVPRGEVDDFYYVVVRKGGAPARRRFTIAHELGHHALVTGGHDAADEEAWCDRYAGRLLMPDEKVEQFVAEARSMLDWDYGPAAFEVSGKTFWTRLWDYRIACVSECRGEVTARGMKFVGRAYQASRNAGVVFEELCGAPELFGDGEKVVRGSAEKINTRARNARTEQALPRSAPRAIRRERI